MAEYPISALEAVPVLVTPNESDGKRWHRYENTPHYASFIWVVASFESMRFMSDEEFERQVREGMEKAIGEILVERQQMRGKSDTV